MRLGEVLRIERDDIQTDRRVLVVHHRKDPRDRQRTDEVPLMRQHPAWPRVDPLALLESRTGDQPFDVAQNTVQFWVRKARIELEMPRLCYHLLRHESLSRYAEVRGFDPLRLMLISGHRDIRHVARYARLDASRLATG
jgi:integrase